jgi:hypothetical protein
MSEPFYVTKKDTTLCRKLDFAQNRQKIPPFGKDKFSILPEIFPTILKTRSLQDKFIFDVRSKHGPLYVLINGSALP